MKTHKLQVFMEYIKDRVVYLMLNTLGGVVGYYITPSIVFLFPLRQEIEASRVP